MADDVSHILEMATDYLNVRQQFDKHRTDKFIWRGIAELRFEERQLRVVVVANSMEEDRTEASRKKWALVLNTGAANLASGESLSAFKRNDVGHCHAAEGNSTDTRIEITDRYFNQLVAEHHTSEVAQESFDFAVRRLEAYAEHPSSPSLLREARPMFEYLRNCLAAADLGTMYGWYEEKMGGIGSYIDDLARRKNSNHPGFKSAQEYITSNLYSFDAPTAWIERPPTLDLETKSRI